MMLTDQHLRPDVLAETEKVSRRALLRFKELEPQLKAQPLGFYIIGTLHTQQTKRF